MKVKRKSDNMVGTVTQDSFNSSVGMMWDVLWDDGLHAPIPCCDCAIMGVSVSMKKIVKLFMDRDKDSLWVAVDQTVQLLEEANYLLIDATKLFSSYEDLCSLLREYGLDEDYVENVINAMNAMA